MFSQPNKFFAAIFMSVLLLFPALTVAESVDVSEENKPSNAPVAKEEGMGDLLITPTRIVFSGRDRSAEVMLKNRDTKSTTYRIGFIDLGVNDAGDYAEVENYEKSAKDFIRYSPKQVTLAAGEAQKVKLLLRKPSSLADGEYRTHMKFQALPGSNFGEDVEATQVTDQVSVKLIPLVGVTIPVIVQKGALQSDVKIQATRSGKDAKITLNRQGARSLLGDIVIKKDGIILTTVNASVLMPAKARTFTIELADAKASSLTAEYVELQGDTATPIASTAF